MLWLWCRPAAIALIRPLDWEPPYAMAVGLEKAKRKKERREERKKEREKENSVVMLQHNRISVFAASGHRFDPQAGIVD